MKKTEKQFEITNRIVGEGTEDPTVLMPNPKNWRLHPKEQLNALSSILEKVGWVQRIIVNKRTGHLVDGHLRVALACKTKQKSVPVVYVDLSEQEEELVLATLDPIAAMAASDKAKLDELMRAVQSDDERVQAMISEIAEKNHIFADDSPEEANEPDYGIIGIKRQRWSFKHGIGFLCLRAFDIDKKHQEMEWLKEVKKTKPQEIIDFITSEIANAIKDTFIDLTGFIVTSAPEHKTGFAKILANNVASKIGVDYQELFYSEINPEAKREIFGDRPTINFVATNKSVIWIDDTLTTGRTLESCREYVTKTFIPIIWIYDRMVGK